MAYDLSPWNRVGERYKLDMSEAPSGKIIISYAPLENLTEESEKYTTDEAYAEQDPLEGCGEYYSYDMLLMPYVLDRPLNRADIIGMTADELKLLRNQFYAIYGRAFDTESLRDYFSEKPWYIALISPSEFDDSVFTLLEKRNIEFLKAIEAEYSEDPEYYDKKVKEEREALDALEEAPYKELIPDYGDCVLYDTDNSSEEGMSYFLAYEPHLGHYSLWHNSADTIFKDVYSGKIYVMKGAEEEYGNYFPLQKNSDDENSPAGGWRHMDFDEENVSMTSAYSGNATEFNEKGYLLGLYYWGD